MVMSKCATDRLLMVNKQQEPTLNETPAQPSAELEPSRPIISSPAFLPPISGRPLLHRILGILIIAIALVIYYATTCPVIYYGDAGELIVAALRGGVAHPPGYPSYILLLAIFLRLPLGWLAPNAEFLQPIAWQANFCSAVTSALTVWIVYLILLRLLRKPPWAFGGALLAATSRTFWSQAGIAEVYALNALLAALMTLIALVMSEEKAGSHRRLVLLRWGSVVWGLALSNHHEMLFFGLVWLTMVALAVQRPSRRVAPVAPPGRAIIEAIIFLAIGLLPYLYLPIAASSKPPLNWGDPSTWQNFWRVLTRADYQEIKGAITGNLVTSFDIFLAFLRWSFFQYSPIFLILLIPGTNVLFRKSPHRPVIWASALSILVMSATFIAYFGRIDRSSLFFLEVYFIPWYLALGGLIAYGAATMVGLGRLYSKRGKAPLVVLGTIILLAGAFFSWKQNLPHSNMRDNIAGYVYSHDVLATLPPSPEKTILITGGDDIFLFWYWDWVEGIDKEIAVVGMDALGVTQSWFWDDISRQHPDLDLSGLESLGDRYEGEDLRWRMLERLARANRGKWRTWLTTWDPVFDPVIHGEPWHMVLDGPALELEWDVEENEPDYPRASVPEDQYLFRQLLDLTRTGLGAFEVEVYERYAAACYNLTLYFQERDDREQAAEFASLCQQFSPYYSAGPKNPAPLELLAYNLVLAGDIELAKEKLLELIENDPENSLYRSYLAEVYVVEGDYEAAIRQLEIALSLEPDNAIIRDLYEQLVSPPETDEDATDE